MHYFHTSKIALFLTISLSVYIKIHATQPTPRPAKKSKTNNHASLFQCPYDDCNKALSTRAGIRTHIQSVHESIRFPCSHPQCNKTFSTKSNMQTHYRSTHQGKRFPCSHPECNKTFYDNRNLLQHVQSAHKGIRVICSYPGCNKTFSTKGHMLQHFNSAHQGVRVACSHPQCNKLFSQKSGMLRHFKKKHSTAIRQKRKQRPEQVVAEALLSISAAFLKEQKEEKSRSVTIHDPSLFSLPLQSPSLHGAQ